MGGRSRSPPLSHLFAKTTPLEVAPERPAGKGNFGQHDSPEVAWRVVLQSGSTVGRGMRGGGGVFNRLPGSPNQSIREKKVPGKEGAAGLNPESRRREG